MSEKNTVNLIMNRKILENEKTTKKNSKKGGKGKWAF